MLAHLFIAVVHEMIPFHILYIMYVQYNVISGSMYILFLLFLPNSKQYLHKIRLIFHCVRTHSIDIGQKWCGKIENSSKKFGCVRTRQYLCSVKNVEAIRRCDSIM